MNGLVIEVINDINWDNLFRILTKSSPTSLFKFKFFCTLGEAPKLESLKLFFDNWEGRHPMLLQILRITLVDTIYFDLVEQYKTKGIVQKYDNQHNFEDFEWIIESFTTIIN